MHETYNALSESITNDPNIQVRFEPDFSERTTMKVQSPICPLVSSTLETPQIYTFSVCISNLEVLNLYTPRQRVPSSLFFILNWNNVIRKRTTTCIAKPRLQYKTRINFSYSVPTLQKLCDTFFKIEMYENVNDVKSRHIGYVKKELASIASGTVRHDLMLHPVVRFPYRRRFHSVRILFHVQMAQVGQFSMIPIELLVHLNNPFTLSKDTVFKNSAEGDFIVEKDRESISKSPSVLMDESFSQVKMTSCKKVTIQQEESRNVLDLNENSQKKTYGSSDTLQNPLVSEKVLVEPFVAEFQITFSPSKVDNPLEYRSTWTPLCSHPYWKSIDHTIQNELSSNESCQAPSTCVQPVKDLSNSRQSSEAGITKSANGRFHRRLDKQIEVIPKVSKMPSYKKNPVTPSLLIKSMTHSKLVPDRLNLFETIKKLDSLYQNKSLETKSIFKDLPVIILQTTGQVLRENHLTLRLYAKRSPLQNAEFFGECWLPFMKIYDVNALEENNPKVSHSLFYEKLWFEGKCIGFVEGIILVQHNLLVRQRSTGVSTDDGIVRVSSSIIQTLPKDKLLKCLCGFDSLPNEVRKLQQLLEKLGIILCGKSQHSWTCMSHTTYLPKMVWTQLKKCLPSLLYKPVQSAWSKHSIVKKGHKIVSLNYTGNLSYYDFESICSQILALLKSFHIQSTRSFLYVSEDACNIGKQCFLNLIHHVLDFIDSIPWVYRNTYYSILYYSLRRGEFYSTTCCSTKNNSNTHCVTSSSNDNTFKAHLKKTDSPFLNQQLWEDYQGLLERLLIMCLEKLSSHFDFEANKKYVSIFLCLLYFRLQYLSQEILACVLTQEEREVSLKEWRGTEFLLDAKSLQKYETWEPYVDYGLHPSLGLYCRKRPSFQTPLICDRSQNRNTEKVLTCGAWKNKMRKRDSCFFSFFENWIKEVYQCINNPESFQWHLVPGYATLLKAFLLEMKSRQVTRYPDTLLNCSGTLLLNEKLLSVFLKILFLKTSVYDTQTVFSTFNFLDYWVHVLFSRNKTLPLNFDFQFFRRGLDIVLSSDICLCVAKALWFLYKNLSIFNAAALKTLVIDLLLNKYFDALLLSWSYLVRRCFILFLFYRICEMTRNWTRKDTSSVQCDTLKTKMMCWGFLEFCNRLQQMGGPPIFNEQIKQKITDCVFSEITLDVKNEKTSYASYDPHTEEMVKRVRHLTLQSQPPVDTTSIPSHCKTYLSKALYEMNSELHLYYKWVNDGNENIPSMTIPSFPLDSSVDVPFDVFY